MHTQSLKVFWFMCLNSNSYENIFCHKLACLPHLHHLDQILQMNHKVFQQVVMDCIWWNLIRKVKRIHKESSKLMEHIPKTRVDIILLTLLHSNLCFHYFSSFFSFHTFSFFFFFFHFGCVFFFIFFFSLIPPHLFLTSSSNFRTCSNSPKD